MKEKFITLRNRFLQNIADYLLFRIEIAMSDREYEQYLFIALWLDDWCKEKDIWLV